MLSNTNYSAKLSPSIKENWLVQVFKNDATSILTNSTPNTIDKDNADYNLRFCFASASGSTKATYNGHDYYPAILNQPTITNSLDLKSFTTNTGSITLNIANIDLAETTLLEILGNEFINGHVNILSQIDDDDTADNALQIFSGKVSSFGYRNNTIILNIISNRPFQNVSLPQSKTTGDFSGVDIPYILGSYNQSSSSVLSKQLYNLYKVPYVRNDNDNMVFLMPNKIADNTTNIASLEFYDKNVQRFIPLNKTGFASTTTAKRLDVSSATGGTTVEVNSQIVKDFNVLPNDFTDHNGNENSMYSSSLLQTSTLTNPANILDLNTDGTLNNTTFAIISNRLNPDDDSTNEDVAGSSIFLKFPKPMHKLTNCNLTIRYSITFTGNSGNSGIKLYMHSDDLSSDNNMADQTNAVFFEGATGSIQKTDVSVTTKTSTIDSTKFNDIFKDGQIQDRLRLSFELTSDEISQGQFDDFTCDLKIYSIFATYTTALTTSDEPIAKQESNANTDFLYIGQGITTSNFNGHSGVNNDLNNPVSIHRQIIKDFAGINSGSGDSENLNNGYKGVAELRDSNTASSTSHWKTRLALYEAESLEQIMKKLQYEGCFFFQYSPQAQQTSIAGATSLRYFTIPDNPTASVDLSQNDISDYEIGITPAQDLETNIAVHYNKHPEENKYEFNEEYLSTNHNTIFGDSTVQKQDINLDLLYDAVAVSGTARNTSWINFRKKLFGDYKTTVSTTLVNPEKYALLEIGDFVDFGEILFSELGSPFNEISDTFDSFVAMPTRLFSEAWSGKKFIITNLKRKIGQVQVQCREV
jgi:hypothetical protein